MPERGQKEGLRLQVHLSSGFTMSSDFSMCVKNNKDDCTPRFCSLFSKHRPQLIFIKTSGVLLSDSYVNADLSPSMSLESLIMNTLLVPMGKYQIKHCNKYMQYTT